MRIFKPSVGDVICCFAFGMVGVILNGAVLMAIRCVMRQNPSRSNFLYIFLANLAATDSLLIVVSLWVKLNCSVKSCGYFDYSCEIGLGIVTWGVGCSMFGTILVAANRFVFILYGIYYNQWFTKKRVYLAIVSSIVIAFISCGPALTPFFVDESSKRCSIAVMPPVELLIYLNVFAWLCISIALIVNLIIFLKVIRTVKNIKRMICRDSSSLRSKGDCIYRWAPSKKRAIKFLFYTTGTFLVTYIPYATATTLRLIYSFEIDEELNVLGGVLVFLTSILNPLVYSLWQKDIQDVFKKSFRCRICLKGPSPVEERSWRPTSY